MRPLFVRLLDHVEIYCRNPRRSQACSPVEVAAAAAAAASVRGSNGGRAGRAESASHAVYDDLALIAEALQRLSVSHFGRDPGRAVDQVSAGTLDSTGAVAAGRAVRAVEPDRDGLAAGAPIIGPRSAMRAAGGLVSAGLVAGLVSGKRRDSSLASWS